MTPTNCHLGDVDPARIAKLDEDGTRVSDDPPSMEVSLHQAFHYTCPNERAVVHLHSTWATAFPCMEDADPDDCIPSLTPDVAMRVGKVKKVPYVKPGDPKSLSARRMAHVTLFFSPISDRSSAVRICSRRFVPPKNSKKPQGSLSR